MPKVLVVEDDHEVAETIEDILKEYGFEVQSLFNSSHAGSMVRKERPDLVITDIFMPRTSGLDVIAELRRQGGGNRILAISGGGQFRAGDYLDYAQALGADAALAKPFNARDLLRAVLAALAAPRPSAPEAA